MVELLSVPIDRYAGAVNRTQEFSLQAMTEWLIQY
jgi:hypothetical protein